MKQIKIVAVAALALTTLVVVLQNTAPVAIKVLFFDAIEIPAALLLFASGVIGFVLGMATSLVLGRGRKVSPPKAERPSP